MPGALAVSLTEDALAHILLAGMGAKLLRADIKKLVKAIIDGPISAIKGLLPENIHV